MCRYCNLYELHRVEVVEGEVSMQGSCVGDLRGGVVAVCVRELWCV